MILYLKIVCRFGSRKKRKTYLTADLGLSKCLVFWNVVDCTLSRSVMQNLEFWAAEQWIVLYGDGSDWLAPDNVIAK